jgi:HEAT repeat protein
VHYGKSRREVGNSEGEEIVNPANSTGKGDAIQDSVADAANLKSLITALASKEAVVAHYARQTLVAIGRPAVPHLAEALGHHSDRVRWEAAYALCEIGDPAAAPALVKALEDRDFGVRWLAANGLIALGLEGMVPLLQALTERGDLILLREGARHVFHVMAHRGFRDQLAPVLAALEDIASEAQAPLAARAVLDTLRKADLRQKNK